MQKYGLNIPNTITVIRILLTPMFMILLENGMQLYALIVFAAAGLSDGLDGFLARYFNQRTQLGAFLDPIADKLLLITAFIGLGILAKIPSWLAIIVISRDVMILVGVAVFSIAQIHFEIHPSKVSKATTFLQITTVIFALLPDQGTVVLTFRPVLFWVTAAITIVSGVHYLITGLNVLQKSLGTPQGDNSPKDDVEK